MKRLVLFGTIATLLVFLVGCGGGGGGSVSSVSQKIGAITGTVKDSNSNPIPDATASLLEKPELNSKTDQKGKFTISNVPAPASYTLLIQKENYSTVEIPVSVEENETIEIPPSVSILTPSTSSDKTPPSVSLTSSGWVKGTVSVSVNASDNEALDLIVFYLDSVSFATSSSSPFSVNLDTTSFSDGSHEIKVKACDKSFNCSYDTSSLLIDNSSPSVSISNPANNQVIEESQEITCDCNDSFSGVSSISIYLGDEKKADSSSWFWDVSSFPEGSYSISCYCKDKAGNESSVSISVSLVHPDITPPSIVINSPKEGSLLNSVVSVDFSVSDESEIEVEVKVDETLVCSSFSCSFDSSSFSDGSHLLTVVATDSSSNTSSSSISISFDNSPPEAPVLSNYPSKTNKQKVTISGTKEQNSSILVNGSELIPLNDLASFSLDLSLSEGTNTFYFSSKDQIGNESSSVKVEILADFTPPSFSISPSSDQIIYASTTIYCTGSDQLSGMEKVELYIDQSLVSSEQGASLSYLFSPTEVKSYSISCYFYDSVSNTSSTSITLTYQKIPQVVFVEAWGLEEYFKPYGLAYSRSDNTIYVNSLDRIYQIDLEFNVISTIGPSVSGLESEFDYLTGIAIDEKRDRIIVGDSGNWRIVILNRSDHSLYKTFGSWGGVGETKGKFSNIHSLTLDDEGNIYVTDGSTHDVVQVFDPEGNFLFEFGGWGQEDGEFDEPYGITIDSNGIVYVADSLNERIQKFTKGGEFLEKFGEGGYDPGEFFWPSGIALSPHNTIYVNQSMSARVDEFTLDGAHLQSFGKYGDGPGELASQEGIIVINNYIFIADTGNNRIQKWMIQY